jgi:mannose-6-phosphate isomerase-like protein (cupin superfamily)
MLQQITYQGNLLAIVVSHKFKQPGIHFFTPDDMAQQLGYIQYQPGKKIEPHYHVDQVTEIRNSQEVLLLRKGKLRVDFYTDQQQYLESHVLEAGDLVMLVSGGHGFEVLEEIEMFEVRQGPYLGEQQRIRFPGTNPDDVKIIDRGER